ncbi:CGNR zinc finger domain-containing protein [Sphaerisporangium sp. TRM90804]|uniref:CGNR zinc finger domain-containing protein n=1 Tax=Sphaerisporangium sp. TRM90804 TaxID=3031113 RepID=UPI002449D408|nr:CGNR zinc finger domain-containing protein [Sphaerisporangium sp. TRM90804]MDH2427322.1 CGNR zinc finger domain-containing protein [Sphaerisporangium sp. TRM90804]
MAADIPDEDFLLEILNSTPVVDGAAADRFADPAQARAWLAGVGGDGTDEELKALLAVRRTLQAVVRGDEPAEALEPALRDVTRVPAVTRDGVRWTLEVPAGRALSVRAILAWSALAETAPGRLRPCANDECRLFLVDRSKANSARWCSMTACGNRMKARRHQQRARAARER